MEGRVNCYFQGKKKVLPLINDYAGFIARIVKEFNLEKISNDLDFFILNNQEKINFDKKFFKKYFLNNNIFSVYCEYNPKNNELSLREENQDLKQKLEDINKILQDIKQQNLILKEKYQTTEDRLILLKVKFEEYKNETQNIISNLESKILNFEANSNNLFLKSSSKYEDTEDIPKPVKRKARTPIDNDDEIFEKEKPINRGKTPNDNSNYFNNKNTYYQSNIGNGDNGKQNLMKISKSQNSGSDNTPNNQEYEDTETDNNSNINTNKFNKNKSINNSNNNFNTSKSIHNSNNNFNKNNLESKKARTRIETPNERNILRKSLSCEFIIDSRIPSKLKSSVKKSYSINFFFKLKNNGKYPIPKNTKIKSNENSDLIIYENFINKGEEIKPNHIIEISISAHFKDKNNITAKIYQVRFYLFHDSYGKIGNDGLIQVEILDESQNIIDISKKYNKNENYYLDKNEQISYYDKGNSKSNENEFE